MVNNHEAGGPESISLKKGLTDHEYYIRRIIMVVGSFIKMGLTIIFLAVLFKRIDLFGVFDVLYSLHIYYWLLAISLTPILCIIRTFRWDILLKSVEINRPFTDLLKILIIGIFYGIITPGKIGEVGRACYLEEKKTKIVPTILIEKIIDILLLTILSFLTILFFFNNDSFKFPILFIGLTILVIFCTLTNKKILSFFVKPLKLTNQDINVFADSFLSIIWNKRTMTISFFLSICYYIVGYISALFLLLSLDINPLAVITFPIVILIGNIPITISGLGLRESVAAICFILLGESGADGVSFSLLIFVTITFLPGILGYLFVLAGKNLIILRKN